MQRESKLFDVPEPPQIKRACETCGGEVTGSKLAMCWRMKGQGNECWYPPGTVKVVDEEPEEAVCRQSRRYGEKSDGS